MRLSSNISTPNIKTFVGNMIMKRILKEVTVQITCGTNFRKKLVFNIELLLGSKYA